MYTTCSLIGKCMETDCLFILIESTNLILRSLVACNFYLEVNVQLFPFTGSMPPLSQPTVKRMKLDDSQDQIQGTNMNCNGSCVTVCCM